jgi:hypothetical protein
MEAVRDLFGGVWTGIRQSVYPDSVAAEERENAAQGLLDLNRNEQEDLPPMRNFFVIGINVCNVKGKLCRTHYDHTLRQPVTVFYATHPQLPRIRELLSIHAEGHNVDELCAWAGKPGRTYPHWQNGIVLLTGKFQGDEALDRKHRSRGFKVFDLIKIIPEPQGKALCEIFWPDQEFGEVFLMRFRKHVQIPYRTPGGLNEMMGHPPSFTYQSIYYKLIRPEVAAQILHHE